MLNEASFKMKLLETGTCSTYSLVGICPGSILTMPAGIVQLLLYHALQKDILFFT